MISLYCCCRIQCCGFCVQDPLFGSVQQRFTGLVYNATALSYRIDPIIIHGAGGSPTSQHPVRPHTAGCHLQSLHAATACSVIRSSTAHPARTALPTMVGSCCIQSSIKAASD